MKRLYIEYDTLFDLYKQDSVISKEDHDFILDQRDKRRLMIGNLTCSKGGNKMISYLIYVYFYLKYF